ncbi:MAG: C-terminal target protein [Flaviaesturariibacter sp.]|nr:C-terminal target protein [Flaviaesturariibacter sp.]
MNSFYGVPFKKGLIFLLSQLFLISAFGQSNCITVTGTVTPVTCFGASNGSISLTPSGGSGNYSYYWSGANGTIGTVQNPSGLRAGTYTVMVRDITSSTCVGSQTFTISQPTALNIEGIDKTWHNGFDLTCSYSTDGELTVRTSGGTAPYLYSLNDGPYQAQNIFSNLRAGAYYVTVKDGNGCYVTNNPNSSLPQSPDFINPVINIVAPAAITSSPIVVLPTVPSSGADSFTIMPTQMVTLMAGQTTGGTENFTYNWSPATGITDVTSQSIMVAPLVSTRYNLAIRDGNNCLLNKQVTLVVGSLTDIGNDVTGGDLYICHNGKSLKVSKKAIPAHIRHGDYIGNCRPWGVAKSTALSDVGLHEEGTQYKVTPNPSSGRFSLQLPVSEYLTEILIMNSTGVVVETRRVLPMTSPLQQFDLKGKAAGTYFIRIVSGRQTNLIKVLIK